MTDEYYREVMGNQIPDAMQLIIDEGITFRQEHFYDHDSPYLKYVNIEALSDNYDGTHEIIAKIDITIIQDSSFLEYVEGLEMADMTSQEFYDVFQDVFKPSESNGNQPIEFLDLGDIIYIKEFVVNGEHRNKGIGTAIMRDVIRNLKPHPSDVILTIPYPIEDRNCLIAKERVIKFWMNQGFHKLKNTDCYKYKMIL